MRFVTINKTPTQALTPPAEKNIGKCLTQVLYATEKAGVNIKVAMILYYL